MMLDNNTNNLDVEPNHEALRAPRQTYGVPSNGLQHYYTDIRHIPRLSFEEERHYGQLAREGNRLGREKMILGNLRLVIKIARGYLGRGLAMDELVAEGNLGLIHAVGKFDPALGFRFSTYATCWIRQYIEQAVLLQSNLLRIPLQLLKHLRMLTATRRRLKREYQRPPLIHELASALNYTEAHVSTLLALRGMRMESIDQPVFEDSECTLVEQIPDPAPYEGWSHLERQCLQQDMEYCMHQLPERLRTVLAMRFGLMGYARSTLDEVASAIGLARERIRTLQLEAIRRLRGLLEARGYSAELLLDTVTAFT